MGCGMLSLLGPIPLSGQLATWIMTELFRKGLPHVQTFLQDPGGTLSRLGDLLVWNGPKGRQVVATLENLTESQGRIEQVVGHIETAQIGIAGNLGALTGLSMATLGVTSLATGFLMWRMNSLQNRLNAIQNQLANIQAIVTAMARAPLEGSLESLGSFERKSRKEDLQSAKDRCGEAVAIYGQLVENQIDGPPQLPLLSQCGRCFMLALTTQARCYLHLDDLQGAIKQLSGKKPTLTRMAKATFEEVMGKSPEAYLDPNLQADNVTLNLLSEVYQHAQRIGAVTHHEFNNASDTFEHFRPRIYGAGRNWFRPAGKAKVRLLTKLKYLMACLEDIGRIDSLQLRLECARDGKISLQDLQKEMQDLEKEMQASSKPAAGSTESCSSGPVMAFAVT